MLIGVPKEIKDNEFRVGIAPAGVSEITEQHGQKVLVESKAGEGIGYTDEDYEKAGATIAASAEAAQGLERRSAEQPHCHYRP